MSNHYIKYTGKHTITNQPIPPQYGSREYPIDLTSSELFHSPNKEIIDLTSEEEDPSEYIDITGNDDCFTLSDLKSPEVFARPMRLQPKEEGTSKPKKKGKFKSRKPRIRTTTPELFTMPGEQEMEEIRIEIDEELRAEGINPDNLDSESEEIRERPRTLETICDDPPLYRFYDKGEYFVTDMDEVWPENSAYNEIRMGRREPAPVYPQAARNPPSFCDCLDRSMQETDKVRKEMAVMRERNQRMSGEIKELGDQIGKMGRHGMKKWGDQLRKLGRRLSK